MVRLNLWLLAGIQLKCRLVNTHRFNSGKTEKQRETHGAGVDVTVDGNGLDAHLATGFDHLRKKKN